MTDAREIIAVASPLGGAEEPTAAIATSSHCSGSAVQGRRLAWQLSAASSRSGRIARAPDDRAALAAVGRTLVGLLGRAWSPKLFEASVTIVARRHRGACSPSKRHPGAASHDARYVLQVGVIVGGGTVGGHVRDQFGDQRRLLGGSGTSAAARSSAFRRAHRERIRSFIAGLLASVRQLIAVGPVIGITLARPEARHRKVKVAFLRGTPGASCEIRITTSHEQVDPPCDAGRDLELELLAARDRP